MRLSDLQGAREKRRRETAVAEKTKRTAVTANLRRPTAADVLLWGKRIGAVAWNPDRQIAEFEYTPEFIEQGLDVSPLVLPRRKGIFSFPSLNPETFRGLPGLLADSLPDRFGNALIDVWLARHGRSSEDFSSVERLCYIGSRGMGAIEFRPALFKQATNSAPVEISELTKLANRVLNDREALEVDLDRREEDTLNTIIRIGTSAGGARAKALIAWDPQTGKVRSGQVPPPPGFSQWILKFDGVSDRVLGDPQGFGRIEYAYYRMAVDAGLEMMESRLLEEGGRAHFMTRRFDRKDDGSKLHMQSLCGLAHYDYNSAGAYGYEQVFTILLKLGLGYRAMEEMFRRMTFNVVARNQDDHTRNVAFLMNSDGKWRLSPAFDLTWAYNRNSRWTNLHQMSINGKRDEITRQDLLSVANQYGVKKAAHIIDEVTHTVSRWPEYAKESGISEDRTKYIASTLRTDL